VSGARAALAQAHRIVVKAGSQVLLGTDGLPALSRFHALLESLAALRREGREVLLVSSGATGLGARRLGIGQRPASLGLAQACAAVGQGELMELYRSGFARLDALCAQVLLTQDDFLDDARRANLRRTLDQLLERGVIPVINENDTVATAELEALRVFGDNDKLSALVAVDLEADLLVLLSDVAGLHTSNPRHDPEASLLPEVAALTPEVLALADGGSALGRGGMASKLEAVRLCTDAGIPVVLASGAKPGVIESALSGRPVGTHFHAAPGVAR